MKLHNALDGYWLAKERDFSPNTIRDYRLTFRRLVDFLNDPEFETLSGQDLNRFLNHLRNHHKLANKTLCNAWIALSSLWTWAEHELSVEQIIRKHVPRPRFFRPPIVGYTEDDVRRIVYATENSGGWRTRNGKIAYTARPTALRDKAIVILLVDTGIRSSELCNLELRDYDPKEGRLHIRRGKGNKNRYVYLGQAAQRVLWRYLATRPNAKPSDPVFTSRDGAPLRRDNLRHLIERLAARAAVPGAHVHRFRHTFAINFLRNGGNVLELQRFLGHERMETIRIYVDLAQHDLSNAQVRASPADHWRL